MNVGNQFKLMIFIYVFEYVHILNIQIMYSLYRKWSTKHTDAFNTSLTKSLLYLLLLPRLCANKLIKYAA